MALRKKQEQEFAKSLFLSQNLTQKEIAERVGVTEKTLSKWIEKEGWDKLKKSALVTKAAQLAMLYDQLEYLNRHIATRPITYDVPDYMLKPTKLKDADGNERLHYPVYNETDYPVKMGNVATPKEADTIAKLSASIKRLETETSIAEVVEVARDYIEFIRPLDLEFAKKSTRMFDIFITDKMK